VVVQLYRGDCLLYIESLKIICEDCINQYDYVSHVLGNWVKTYHPRSIEFTEFVSIFVSKPQDEKFSFTKRKHPRKDPDEFYTSC
jgi:hypothetical protein